MGGNGIHFPTESAGYSSQQEIGCIYKTHNPKLTSVGLPALPPLCAPSSRHILPPKIPQQPQGEQLRNTTGDFLDWGN